MTHETSLHTVRHCYVGRVCHYWRCRCGRESAHVGNAATAADWAAQHIATALTVTVGDLDVNAC